MPLRTATRRQILADHFHSRKNSRLCANSTRQSYRGIQENNIWLARRCPAFATNRLCQCCEPLVGTCDRARKRNGHALHTGCLPRSPYPTIVYRELCACCRCLNRWLCIGVFCFENCRGAHPCWNTPRRNPNSHECASSFVSTGHNASDDDPVRSCPGSPHDARQLAAAAHGQRQRRWNDFSSWQIAGLSGDWRGCSLYRLVDGRWPLDAQLSCADTRGPGFRSPKRSLLSSLSAQGI